MNEMPIKKVLKKGEFEKIRKGTAEQNQPIIEKDLLKQKLTGLGATHRDFEKFLKQERENGNL